MDIVHCPPVHIQTQFVIVAIQNCQNCQNLSILRLIPRHHATFAYTMRFICGLSVYKTTMALMIFYILTPFQKTSEQFLNEIFLFNITCFGSCQQPGSPYDDDDGDDGDRDDDHGQWQVSAYWGRLPCQRLLSFEPGFLSWGWRGWWRWGLFFERNSFSLLNILTAPDGQLLHTTTTHTSFYLNVPNFITLNDRERDQKFLWLFRLEVGQHFVIAAAVM